MRKRIYVAYTGGTIGMRPSQRGFVPAPGFLSETLRNMPEFHRPEMPEFYIHEYDNLIDSSDMSPRDWQRMANDIAAHYDDYDGFIILHGTDTMAYTASALSFMLEGLTKPVIVTGSQIPLAQLRSDGQVNLLNALYIAANYPIAEVGLFFNNRLFRGNRARKLDANGFDAFGSPNYPPLIEAGISIKVTGQHRHVSSTESLYVSDIHPQPIGMVSLYPGISAEVIRNTLQQPVKALVLLSYGVGNAPQSKAIVEQLASAKAQEIVVLNCTQCTRGKVDMMGYATGQALAEIGVVSGADMTPEAALAKLHYLLSKSLPYTELKQQLSTNLCGELTE
ncbi:asparaginase [Alteromonas oceanisediminis]|uniref:asparaginase n=1 Tax=Alteromonas oceanisediminis TaxID=2836180 RepID=UPI001BDB53C3|nr:asparaginase [Alteromonas oceanisediminis]MBT0586540.1 asparaginase [Alteromonas oceanisediminis]